jgi:hypothetical protein
LSPAFWRPIRWGHFYNAQIKGRFDCRVYRMPAYKKLDGS